MRRNIIAAAAQYGGMGGADSSARTRKRPMFCTAALVSPYFCSADAERPNNRLLPDGENAAAREVQMSHLHDRRNCASANEQGRSCAAPANCASRIAQLPLGRRSWPQMRMKQKAYSFLHTAYFPHAQMCQDKILAYRAGQRNDVRQRCDAAM